MSENVIITYKDLGETPLECLERARNKHNISNTTPMTYAGRLDPMAEGVIIILIGEECKKKGQYLGLDKTYEFEVLVGFETDTQDLLGVVTSPEITFERSSDLPAEEFDGRGQTVSKAISGFVPALQSFIGTFIQKYPSFSSKTVGGKQLFQLSRDDELPDEMPEHEVTISRLECVGEKIILKEDLQKEILRRIGLVHGDFRQEEIIEKWNEVFDNSKEKEFTIFKYICECSSGTYIRQLVADISEKMEVPMVTYSIKRTKVEEYTL